MLKFLPLIPATWHDLVKLFGEKGACGGCWCMYWRLKAADFNRQKGDANKKALKKIMERTSPGMLAYDQDRPVGWCAIAPREEYIRLEGSKILKPIDDKAVWSVGCFFIKKQVRNNHLTVPLLKAAVDFAGQKGAKIVEGYPTDPINGHMPDTFAWAGLMGTFQKAGFKEVERRSRTRPVMRYHIT